MNYYIIFKDGEKEIYYIADYDRDLSLELNKSYTRSFKDIDGVHRTKTVFPVCSFSSETTELALAIFSIYENLK